MNPVVSKIALVVTLCLSHQIAAENPPEKWSVVRDENIVWRTTLPEGGQSAVTILGNRAFTTMHRPIEESDARTEPNVIGLCLDATTGEILWKANLPGTDPVQMAGIFSDATVFAPIAEGKRVWFFNRCGSMGCFDIETGKQVWLRKFQPRPRHTNRECEPILTGDLILTVEVKDKEAGQKMQRHKPVPEGVDPRDVWTYLHAIDKNTGGIRWVGEVGTAVHNAPQLGKMADGTVAVAHGRGGGHGPLEKPYGVSLTRISDGKTLWSHELKKTEASFNTNWNERHVYWWEGKNHLVIDTNTGELLRSQNVFEKVDFCRFDEESKTWNTENDVAVPEAKRMRPTTYHTNVVVGNWHYFLSHNQPAIGRVNMETGKVEYLQLPAQLAASAESRGKDQWIWDKAKAIPNNTKNSRGIDIAPDKRAKGTGWGHVSAATPLLVGDLLYAPILTGTVFVIDTSAENFDQKAIVAINDLGLAGETWTLSNFSISDGKLFTRTMKEVICIGAEKR